MNSRPLCGGSSVECVGDLLGPQPDIANGSDRDQSGETLTQYGDILTLPDDHIEQQYNWRSIHEYEETEPYPNDHDEPPHTDVDRRQKSTYHVSN